MGGRRKRKEKPCQWKVRKICRWRIFLFILSFYSFFFLFFFCFPFFFFVFSELFQFFSREEGRMAWWIKVEELLTVQSWPLFHSAAHILCNPEQVITSHCPSSSPLKWVKTMFAFSGKDTWRGASSSLSLEGCCREGRENAPGSKLAASKGWSCIVPCKGSRAEELSSFFQPHILIFSLL